MSWRQKSDTPERGVRNDGKNSGVASFWDWLGLAEYCSHKSLDSHAAHGHDLLFPFRQEFGRVVSVLCHPSAAGFQPTLC
jgi:hypothetical protein